MAKTRPRKTLVSTLNEKVEGLLSRPPVCSKRFNDERQRFERDCAAHEMCRLRYSMELDDIDEFIEILDQGPPRKQKKAQAHYDDGLERLDLEVSAIEFTWQTGRSFVDPGWREYAFRALAYQAKQNMSVWSKRWNDDAHDTGYFEKHPPAFIYRPLSDLAFDPFKAPLTLPMVQIDQQEQDRAAASDTEKFLIFLDDFLRQAWFEFFDEERSEKDKRTPKLEDALIAHFKQDERKSGDPNESEVSALRERRRQAALRVSNPPSLKRPGYEKEWRVKKAREQGRGGLMGLLSQGLLELPNLENSSETALKEHEKPD